MSLQNKAKNQEKQPDVVQHFQLYLILLYLGFGLLGLGGFLYFFNQDEGSFPILVIGIIILIFSSVFQLVVIYRLWDFIVSHFKKLGLKPSVQTPGEAIGYLFIPLFNVYWMFMVYGKLPVCLNKLKQLCGQRQTASDSLGILIPLLSLVSIIPVIGWIIGPIVGLVLMPVFLHQCISVCHELPEEIGQSEVEEANVQPEYGSIKYLELFHVEKYGINYPLLLWMLLGSVLVQILWFVYSGWKDSGLDYHTSLISQLALAFFHIPYAIGFIAINHFAKNRVLIVLLVGVLGLLQTVLYAWVMPMFDSRGTGFDLSTYSISTLISVFFNGVMFSAALILAVERIGVKWWAIWLYIVLAGMIGNLATMIPMIWNGYFNYSFLFYLVLSQTITATCLYFGLSAWQRKILLKHK